MRKIDYQVVFKHTFKFNGYTYHGGVAYTFTAVCVQGGSVSDFDVAQYDYGERFSGIYFEIEAPLTVIEAVTLER